MRYLYFAALLLILASCTTKYHKFEGAVWNTEFHITYLSDENLDDSILAVMNKVDMTLSQFNDSSMVAKINSGLLTEVDSTFIRVYNCAKEVSEKSGGKYDPTIAPLIDFYGFGPKKIKLDHEPKAEEIDSVLNLVGLTKTNLEGNKISLNEGMKFDFSSIAKGLGCDMIGEMLSRHGCRNYMIEIGGEIAVRGENDRGEPWHIQIDLPQDNNQTVSHERLEVITPGEDYPDGQCGIATSGNYRNYYTTETGERINHIIDAITGRQCQSPILSATMIAPDCMTADALATACMTLNVEEARKMINQFAKVKAILVVGDKVVKIN